MNSTGKLLQWGAALSGLVIGVIGAIILNAPQIYVIPMADEMSMPTPTVPYRAQFDWSRSFSNDFEMASEFEALKPSDSGGMESLAGIEAFMHTDPELTALWEQSQTSSMTVQESDRFQTLLHNAMMGGDIGLPVAEGVILEVSDYGFVLLTYDEMELMASTTEGETSPDRDASADDIAPAPDAHSTAGAGADEYAENEGEDQVGLKFAVPRATNLEIVKVLSPSDLDVGNIVSVVANRSPSGVMTADKITLLPDWKSNLSHQASEELFGFDRMISDDEAADLEIIMENSMTADGAIVTEVFLLDSFMMPKFGAAASRTRRFIPSSIPVEGEIVKKDGNIITVDAELRPLRITVNDDVEVASTEPGKLSDIEVGMSARVVAHFMPDDSDLPAMATRVLAGPEAFIRSDNQPDEGAASIRK